MDGTSILILATTASCFAVGIASLARCRGRGGRAAFGVGAILVGLWLFALGSVRVSPDESVAIGRARAAAALAALVPVPWSFAGLLLGREGERRLLRRWVPYLAAVVAAAAFFAARAYGSGLLFGLTRTRDGLLVALGPVGRFFMLYLIAALLVFIFNLEATARSAHRSALRRIKYWIIGLGAAAGYHVFLASAALLYSIVRLPLLAAGAVPVLAACALTAYAVVTRRLDDARVRVGRPVFYNSITALLAGAYLLALGVFGAAARARGWTLPMTVAASSVFVALLVLAFFLASERVRRGIRRFVDTNFYVSRYDYRREWAGASRMFASELSEAVVATRIEGFVTDTLDATAACVVPIERDESGERVVRSGDPGLDAALGDPEFLVTLDGSLEALRVGPDGTGAGLREWSGRHSGVLKRDSWRLAGPLVAGGELVGAILVGPRRAGGYTNEDLDLLSTVGLQAGNAILAARLTERVVAASGMESIHRLTSFWLHDLKNCASSLSLALENADGRMSDPEFQRDLLRVLESSVATLRKIIDRTTAARPRLEIRQARIGVKEIVEESVTKAGLRNGSAVATEISVANGLAVEGDRALLGTVFRNLLTNAVEATGGRGTIDVSAEPGGEASVIVRIADDGPGIPADLLAHGRLFSPFVTSKEEGVGLGLYQCRVIVEAHGGRVEAANGERGAVFELVLPRAKIPPAAGDPAGAQEAS